MPRRSPSRLDKRREAEALEALEQNGSTAAPKRKKAAAKKKAVKKTATRARRTRKEATVRNRMVWAVFSGSMKEEARFPYDQREAAEEKVEQLRSRSKKLYFIQPVKEPLSDSPVVATAAEVEPEEELELETETEAAVEEDSDDEGVDDDTDADEPDSDDDDEDDDDEE